MRGRGCGWTKYKTSSHGRMGGRNQRGCINGPFNGCSRKDRSDGSANELQKQRLSQKNKRAADVWVGNPDEIKEHGIWSVKKLNATISSKLIQ